jgi:hypothetical protein
VKEPKLNFGALVYPVEAAFWIFVIWALWTIVKSFTSIAESLQQIARYQQRPPS